MEDNLTNYKIIGFDESIAQIIVKYDLVDYAIPLDLHPDENGYFLEGEELDRWIRNACPTGFITRKKVLENGIKNIDSIRSLVQPLENESNTSSQPSVSPSAPFDSSLSVDEIQKLISGTS